MKKRDERKEVAVVAGKLDGQDRMFAEMLALVKLSEFRRGVVAAADVAAAYDSTSTHPYRLGDCILAKLNVGRRKPRRNRGVQRGERDSWVSGYAVALAEMHRGHGDSTGVCEAARTSGLTLQAARAAGVSAFDLKELKKAGVP